MTFALALFFRFSIETSAQQYTAGVIDSPNPPYVVFCAEFIGFAFCQVEES